MSAVSLHGHTKNGERVDSKFQLQSQVMFSADGNEILKEMRGDPLSDADRLGRDPDRGIGSGSTTVTRGGCLEGEREREGGRESKAQTRLTLC